MATANPCCRLPRVVRSRSSPHRGRPSVKRLASDVLQRPRRHLRWYRRGGLLVPKAQPEKSPGCSDVSGANIAEPWETLPILEPYIPLMPNPERGGPNDRRDITRSLRYLPMWGRTARCPIHSGRPFRGCSICSPSRTQGCATLVVTRVAPPRAALGMCLRHAQITAICPAMPAVW